MDICGAAHPEQDGVTCTMRSDPTRHPEHIGFDTNGPHSGVVEWANAEFVPPTATAVDSARKTAIAISNRIASAPVVGRNDPPNSHEAARRIEPQRGTRKALVLARLREARGDWVDGTELETADVGGSQGTRRARELRAEGWPIDLRPHPTEATTWQYALAARVGQESPG